VAADLRLIDGAKSNAGYEAYAERIYDQGAEEAVLASINMEPSYLAEAPFLRAAHFRSESGRRIFEAMLALIERGAAIDTVSVASELRANGRLAQIGGMAEWTRMINAAPVLSVANFLTHARRVRDLWVRSELWKVALAMRGRIEGDAADEATLIGWIGAEIERLGGELGSSEKNNLVAEVAGRMLAEVQQVSVSTGKTARPCGYPTLDAKTAGLHPELLIIGARPGMGKTALMCGMGCEVATTTGGVYIASLETKQETLFLRMACARAAVELHRARVGDLTPEEWDRFKAAANTLAALPIWIDDTPAISVLELWGKARRAKLHLRRNKSDLALVAVDYVQLLRAPRPMMKREEIVSENVRALKAMGQDLNVPVVGLAQLSRAVDGRPDKRPQLSDLRESGELEQCARTVLLMYRPDYYAKKKRDYTPTGRVEINVAKQNNGPTGIIELAFDELSTRFSDEAGDGLPQPLVASNGKGVAHANGQDIFTQRTVGLVVSAIWPTGMRVVDLKRHLGDANGMAVDDVEHWLKIAAAQNRIQIDGDGDARAVRRVP
jgi:replicative DNA helicase